MADQRLNNNKPTFFRGEFSFVNKDANSIDSKEHNAIVSKHVMNKYGQWKRQLSDSVLLQTRSTNPPGSSLSKEIKWQPIEMCGLQSSNFDSSADCLPHGALAAPATLVEVDYSMTKQPSPVGISRPRLATRSVNAASGSANSVPLSHSTMQEDYFSVGAMSGCHTVFDIGGHDYSTSPERGGGDSANRVLTSVPYISDISQKWSVGTTGMMNSYETTQDWNNESLVNSNRDQSKDGHSNNFGLPKENTSELSRGWIDDQHPSHLLHTSVTLAELESPLPIQPKKPEEHPQTIMEAHFHQFWLETIANNLTTARTHLKALRGLVIAQGGMPFLESSFGANLLAADCYFALKYGTRPVFPSQEWTPGPLSQHWKVQMISKGVGTQDGPDHHVIGISDLLNFTPSHPKLRSILVDLRELFETHEYIDIHGAPADDQLFWWIKMRKLDCISRLGDYRVDLAIYPHLHEKPRTQTLVNIAASLIANMVLGSPEPMKLGSKLVSELRLNFMEGQIELEREWDLEPKGKGKRGQQNRLRLQFWMLYVGTLAEKMYSMEGIHKPSFGVQLFKLASTLGLHDWAGMRKELQPFLFFGSLHRKVIIEEDCHLATDSDTAKD